MKTIRRLFFIIPIIFVGCFEPQPAQKSDTVCYVYEHSYEFGIPEKEGHLKEIRRYKDTLLIKKQFINRQKRKRDYRKYEYDNEGKLITETLFSRRNMLLRLTKYQYDEKNRRYLEQSYDRNGRLIHKKEWVYEAGHSEWVQWTEFDEHGLLKQVKITEFDQAGQRTAGKILGRRKMPVANFKVEERDSLGNETLNVFYEPDGTIMTRISKKFDRKGRIVFEHYEGKYKKSLSYKAGRLERETFFDLLTGEKKKLIRYVYISV